MAVVERYYTLPKGQKYTQEYKVYFYDSQRQKTVSPFHDIPLFSDESKGIVNMIVEIPRNENAKFEINTKLELNPIKQDIKKDKLRFVPNLFPTSGYPWNYGAIPQTWEDPEYIDPDTSCKGDNDPLDIIEIGSKKYQIGDVVKVKIVGCVALIDEGETDWKMIGISIDDERHDKVNSLNSLNEYFPNLLNFTIFWFRNYKVPSGSCPNRFAFEGTFYKDPTYALSVINKAHQSWTKLISLDKSSLSIIGNSDFVKHKVKIEFIGNIANLENTISNAIIPDEVNNVHYIPTISNSKEE